MIAAFIDFTKMHGAGNDMIVIDGRSGFDFDIPSLAVALCDRHLGIGSDGVIIVQTSDISDFRMLYYNADGSRANCGNGIRCMARYIYTHQLVPREKKDFRIETDAGPVEVTVLGEGERVRVEMPVPLFEGKDIPLAESGEHFGREIQLRHGTVRVSAANVANPVCVVYVENVDSVPVETLGPEIEHHPFFPKRTNVAFVQVLDRKSVKVRIWERGCAETLACGSGASAVISICIKSGKVESPVTAHARGGMFLGEWAGEGSPVILTGPAEEVFSGRLRLAAIGA